MNILLEIQSNSGCVKLLIIRNKELFWKTCVPKIIQEAVIYIKKTIRSKQQNETTTGDIRKELNVSLKSIENENFTRWSKVLFKGRKSSIITEFELTDVENNLGEISQSLGMEIHLSWQSIEIGTFPEIWGEQNPNIYQNSTTHLCIPIFIASEK